MELIQKPGSHEGVLNLKSFDAFSWVPGFQIHLSQHFNNQQLMNFPMFNSNKPANWGRRGLSVGAELKE